MVLYDNFGNCSMDVVGQFEKIVGSVVTPIDGDGRGTHFRDAAMKRHAHHPPWPRRQLPPGNSNVIPVLMRRLHEAKVVALPEGAIWWGTWTPPREFLCVNDMAAASVYATNLASEAYRAKSQSQRSHINVGYSSDLTIAELAQTVAGVGGYTGWMAFDANKQKDTPRKLRDSGRLNAMGWRALVGLEEGLRRAYQDMLAP